MAPAPAVTKTPPARWGNEDRRSDISRGPHPLLLSIPFHLCHLPQLICFASPQHSTAYFCCNLAPHPALLSRCRYHLTVAMPSDNSRTTRSGRITKQISRSSLADRSTASSISRLRPRDSSTNLQVPRPSCNKSRPNISAPRQNAAEATAIHNLIAAEEERIRLLLAVRQSPDKDN